MSDSFLFAEVVLLAGSALLFLRWAPVFGTTRRRLVRLAIFLAVVPQFVALMFLHIVEGWP